MSYNILNKVKYLQSSIDVFKGAQAQAFSVGSAIKFTTHDSNTSHKTFVNQSGELEAFTSGTNEYNIVIPNDGHTYYLSTTLDYKAPYPSSVSGDYYRFRFYDSSNSNYVGFTGTKIRGFNQYVGTVGGVVSDEMARLVIQGPITLQLRISEKVGSSLIDVDVSSTASTYPTQTASSRLFIWKL